MLETSFRSEFDEISLTASGSRSFAKTLETPEISFAYLIDRRPVAERPS